MKTTILDEYLKDEEFRRFFAQEDLIMEVTETLCEVLEKEKISRKELADRLGKTKGFVSQLLNGGRNLTLRTIADILHMLGYKISLRPYKEKKGQEQCNVIEFQTTYIPHKKPVEHWKEPKLPHADNYPGNLTAIFG